MSQMELRSSRSRSKTPFVNQEFIEHEVSGTGNHVVKTTRRTMVVKTNESASSSTDEINTSREILKSTARKSGSKGERSLRSRIFKTSDYSSEDGESEVTSSKTIKQNKRNHLVEDARSLINGSERPALELYMRSGRYWDEYPKTDWTYSHHSKDRVEIVPGVVAMPNMSRKTIHSLDDSYESSQATYTGNVSHKNINTDTFTAPLEGNLKRKLFNNNSEEYYIKRRTHTKWSRFKQTVLTIFMSIFTTIFSVFHYTYRVQTGAFSHIHRAASKVMLWDTYLLWKSRPGDKATKLALLCLVPLLLFGGLWFLSGLGGVLYGTLSNYTASSAGLGFWDDGAQIKRFERSSNIIEDGLQASENDEFILDSDNRKTIIEGKVVKVASASEIASSFTQEQLEAIALAVKNSIHLEDDRSQVNTEKLVEKILNNPSFVNVINNYYQNELIKRAGEAREDNNEELLNKHEILIENLLNEIENMKQEIILNNKLRSEDYARLSLDVKKCCEKEPIINIEAYVSRIVTDLLNNHDFLNNQEGLNTWLHTLFIAKQDLEYRLGNLTATMDSKLAAIINANSQLLMDKVAAKLMQVDHEAPLTEESFVRRIVKEALAIYDADRTGLVDYAMENMGGQILTTRCTEPYHYGKAVVSVLGIPLWHITNSPRTVITPTIAPGDCWAFQNFPGFVVIKLSNTVNIDAFSMEHISRLLIPEGKMDSAPKDFEVYGLKEENDKEPMLLGSYTFQYDGDPLQFFLVEKDDQIFDMIEIRIVSNHGNPNYTCLYRFRVHGKMHDRERR